MKAGIYQISSLLFPDKIYIGSSADLLKRKSQHFKHLAKGIHHNIHLQRHFDKYPGDLYFRIIHPCAVDELIKQEQLFINILKPVFNIAPTAGSNRGAKHTKKKRIALPNTINGFPVVAQYVGKTDSRKHTHTFRCSACGNTITRTISEIKAKKTHNCGCIPLPKRKRTTPYKVSYHRIWLIKKQNKLLSVTYTRKNNTPHPHYRVLYTIPFTHTPSHTAHSINNVPTVILSNKKVL